MKRSKKSIVLPLVAVVIISILIINRKAPRNDVKGEIFSKQLTDKTSVSIKDDFSVKNNVIYINIDGFSYSTFDIANKNTQTETKNINELIRNGVLFTNARTGIPSITSSMQQSIISGAWPIDTGNCYRYYDLNKDKVVEYSRENKLENIAEAANRNDVPLLAINSWYFKENGSNQEKDNLYIIDPTDKGFEGRFNILKSVLKGEEINAYGKRIKYDIPPQFMSIYIDELDGAAHNLNDKTKADSKIDLKTRKEVEQRMTDILVKIDNEIGEVIHILKQRELYDNTTFVITTDHGTVPLGASSEGEIDSKEYAYSQMPDLLKTIAEVGNKHVGRDFKVEMANKEGDKAKDDSEIIVTSPGIQAQIVFREEPSEELVNDIIKSVKGKPYYGTHMIEEELRVRGVPPRFADIMISPKAPYHFSHDFERGYFAINQHDSLDERVQHIFTMISGPAVKNGEFYDGEVYNIDMAPTMARILGFEGPKDATASAVDQVLTDEYKGPKLEVINFKEDVKTVKEDSAEIKIDTEPGASISINKKTVGNADENGKFNVEENLEKDINRFIIESIKDKKSTRRVVFVIKR